MRVASVVGARPNFVKIAPLLREMRHRQITSTLIHTGQHYDDAMSEQFFRDLEITPPDANLGVGSGSHAVQTAEVMRRLEPLLVESGPDLVLVVGDVNSTIAAALAAPAGDLPGAPQGQSATGFRWPRPGGQERRRACGEGAGNLPTRPVGLSRFHRAAQPGPDRAD